MLSGATLIGYHKKYDTKTFFKKRIKKTFVPFLAMSILFSILYIYTKYDEQSAWVITKTILAGFITGNIPFTTYWFFIPLFLLYAFMPFLSVMVENLTQKQLACLIGLMFVLQSCFVPIISLSNRISWIGVPVHSLPICGYVLYALLGYYISHNDIEKNNKVLRWIVVFAVLLLMGRYFLVYNATSHSPAIFNYMAAYAVVPSVAMFMVIKRIAANQTGGQDYRIIIKTKFWNIPNSTVCDFCYV